MYTRLDEVPIYECRESELNAIHFNHVQVGLKRIHRSLRYRIPKLKHLDLILQKEAWIIVDHVLNDVPVAAWTAFQIEGRSDLYQPIKCKLQTYHAHADLILTRTLEAMEMLLGEELQELEAPESTETKKVLPFESL